MSKEATLFTVHRHTVEVHDRYFTRIAEQQPIAPVGGEYLESAVFWTERLPIHHIKKIKHGRRVDDYIVIDPELREILEAPLREDLFSLTRDLSDATCLNQHYAGRIAAFNALPWYRRIFRRV